VTDGAEPAGDYTVTFGDKTKTFAVDPQA